MKNPPHTVVTGSSGFIGKPLVERLRADGRRVTGWDVKTGVDVCKWDQIDAVTDIDVIVHLAARTDVAGSFSAPGCIYRTNLLGTVNVLEKARRTGARVVFASSYVYGVPEYLPVDEQHPVSALNPYAQSKLLGEDLCRAYHRDSGVGAVVLRLFNVFGPGQAGGFLIPAIMAGLEDGTVRLKDPAPRRDFVYIDDVVEAFARAVALEDAAFEVFNVGSGRSCSVGEVAAMIAHLSKRPCAVHFSGERRAGEIADTVADTAKARNRLGWAPRTDLVAGIRCILDSLEK